MNYYTLKHFYEDIPPYYFSSKMDEKHFEDFIAFLMFQYEELTDETESLSTEDVYLILNSFSYTKPLDCKIQNVKDFKHLDLYIIRENYCGSNFDQFMERMKQEYNIDVINSFLKETESYLEFNAN